MKSGIAVFDIGKTNKKLLVFDEQYNVVYSWSGRFDEIKDEDGFACEDVAALRSFVHDSLLKLQGEKLAIKAINFCAYGASLVYINEEGTPVAPLYNYLKPYPVHLQNKFYNDYGGQEAFSLQTASPVLGSLNSGMQLYRLKYGHPDKFKKTKYALHLPQYLSYLITQCAFSEMTSIGCHTNLWNFNTNGYHHWVMQEGMAEKLGSIVPSSTTVLASVGKQSCYVGVGLHDSSAALIPYQLRFKEPFVLLSTGTWCISLNPFNKTPLTLAELKNDSLCYLDFEGQPVKAARFFGGREYDETIERTAAFFNVSPSFFHSLNFNTELGDRVKENGDHPFHVSRLDQYKNSVEAYYTFMQFFIEKQKASTVLVIRGTAVKKIFVDGGFSKNDVYMNLLAKAFRGVEVYAAALPHGTAIGAAMAVHEAWNGGTLPGKRQKDLTQWMLVKIPLVP